MNSLKDHAVDCGLSTQADTTAPNCQANGDSLRSAAIAGFGPAIRFKCSAATAFGCPRNFLDNRFVYVVISPRARGLSIGIDLNPDGQCNFDCIYCEVNRVTPRALPLDLEMMGVELQKTLRLVESGGLRETGWYRDVPDELLRPRHVALSGDGEPTLCPSFLEAVETVMHVRACGDLPPFKVVLITNATGLDLPTVREGLKLFTRTDEIWAKLDAGTQSYMEKINRPQVSIEKVLSNILLIGRVRPVIIQSLFSSISGEGPSFDEIEAYARRLQSLQTAGAQISLVQIYSATRPTPHSEVGHLPLRSLSQIGRRVRELTSLQVEVF